MKAQTRVYYEMLGRRSLKVLPRFLLSLFCFGLLFLLSSFVMNKSSGQNRVLPKIPVAIVLEKGDLASRLTASVVENVDAVQAVGDIQYLSQEEAEERFADGSLQAAIYLPKDVYEDINSGANTPIKIQVSSQAAFGTALFQDLVQTGEQMLQTGEAAVYAIYEADGTYIMKAGRSALMNSMAQKFLSLALKRHSLWNSEILSPFGEVSVENFYLLTALMGITVILCGFSFVSLYEEDSRTTDQCLARAGIRAGHRTMARLLPITVMLYLLQLGILGLLGALTDLVSFSPALVLTLLPLAFSEAALVHLLHVLVSGPSGGLLYLAGTLLLFLLGGSFLPLGMLPRAVGVLARVLPISVWQQYGYAVLWKEVSLPLLGAVLGVGVLLTVLGIIGEKCHERT